MAKDPIEGAEGLPQNYSALVAEHQLLTRDLAFFREFTDSASVGIQWLKPDGTILWANQWQLDVCGYSAPDYINHHITEFYIDDFARKQVLSALSKGEPVRQCELRVKRPDGTLRHLRIDTNVLSDNGVYIHSRAFTVDVTETKQAEERNAYLAAIVSSSDDAIVSKTLDGIITSWNRGAERLFGYTADEMVGQPIVRLIPVERQEEEQRILASIRQGQQVDHFETQRRRKDGTLVEISLTVSPVIDAAGTIIGASKVARDITKQRQNSQTDAYLAAIVSSSDDAIVSKTLDGIVKTWNRGAERLFGYTAAEMIGQPILRLIPPERHEEEQRILASIRRGEPIGHFETIRRRKNGTLVEISLTVSPIIDAAGTIIGASKVARDITKQKQIERQIQEREEQFRTLANAIPQLAWMADPTGHIFWYNRLWYSFTGTTPEEMQGWGWQAVHDPNILPLVLQRWKASLASGEPFEMEFPLRAANGQFRMFLTRVNPIRNSDGHIVRWFGTNTDIEDLKRTREALSESVSTLATLNKLGQTISAELDLDKLAQMITDTATGLVGAAFGALFYNVTNDKGQSYTLYCLSGAPREAFAQFPMPRRTQVFAPTFDGTGVVRSDDITKDPRYGKSSPYFGMPQGHLPVKSYLAVPVISRSQEVLGGLFFGHPKADVFTDKAEDLVKGLAAQAAIAIDNAQLYQKSLDAIRIRDQFLSIASHELKTPLTSLKLQVQIRQRALGKGEMERFAPENLPQLLAEDEKQINRIMRLVEDMLDISRLQAGKLSLNLERVDLYTLVQESVDRFSEMIAGSQCAVTITGSSVIGEWDRYRIEQVVTNLLTNAIKYGAGNPVAIEVRPRGSIALLAIRDHGVGIALKDQERIFAQFERAENSRGLPGLGLGLYIVKQLVESHGGRVWTESEIGKGAAFFVELPFKPVDGSVSTA